MDVELVHKHIILRIEANKPPNEEELKAWMVELVDKVGMKILAGPISGNIDYMPGNNGPTCVVIIETSPSTNTIRRLHMWTIQPTRRVRTHQSMGPNQSRIQIFR